MPGGVNVEVVLNLGDDTSGPTDFSQVGATAPEILSKTIWPPT